MSSYTFQKAASPEDFAEIHRLNHRIFVDEVRQHEPTGTGLLVDRFHRTNTYFTAKRGGRLVGMVSVNDQPPFSVANKLKDTGSLKSLGPGLLEVRLLAVDPNERNRRVLAGLLCAVLNHSLDGDYTHLIISGVRGYIRMYERLGFRAIGPRIAAGNAEFTPMALRISDLPVDSVNRFRKWATRSKPLSLLPGPVQTSSAVHLAFSGTPVSHRSPGFITEFEEIRMRLTELSGGMRAALFPGSGTLANDIAAAAIAADPTARLGLILSNGEFGCRLVQHARRWRLPHTALCTEWGGRWDMKSIAACLDGNPDIDWIWAVQLETSTGMLNNTKDLLKLAKARGIAVFLDCVSGFGAMKFDPRGVALATTVSGKSIGGYSGAAIVLVQEDAAGRFKPALFPPSLDLPTALRSRGPLMTFPSGVMKALGEALSEQGSEKWKQYSALGNSVRRKLRAIGLPPLVDGPDAAPVITTFGLSTAESCTACIKRCALAGFAIGGESNYLRERNWLQIATMGEIEMKDLTRLFAILRQ